jgi:hypothetical protein
MPQLTYSFSMPAGFPGERADADSCSALNRAAAAAIAFGLGLVQCSAVGSETKARIPYANGATLTFSVDLIAANSVAGNVVTTNAAGVVTIIPLTPTVFAVSHAATMAALAAKILAVAGIASAVVAGDVITVTASPDFGVNLTGFAVTLGATQPTSAVALSSTDRFLGVSMQTQVELGYGTGVAQYLPGDMVPVAGKGRFFVTAEQSVTIGDPVYCRFTAGSGAVIGSFRKDADTATAFQVPQARWLSAATAGNVAVIEFNLP